MSVGVSVGPFSASGGLGGGRQVDRGIFYPVTLEQFVAQAQAEGFSVQVTPGTSATIERRWMAGQATVVPRGVVMRRIASTWQILSIVGAVVLVPVLCCLPGILSSRS